MLLVDDVLSYPVRGVLWVFREIHNAAMEELANEAQAITAQLSDLYMRLEMGRITEEEFAAEETILLDRLDRAQSDGMDSEKEDGDEDEDPS